MATKHISPLEESYKLIEPPGDLTSEEKEAWDYFVNILKNGTRYKKTLADAELIRQFVQHKVMRDRAWQEWNKKPERYIRIVTGICADGTTPKIIVKENEYYRTLNDCIANSIQEFGFNDPLAVAGEDNVVLEGKGVEAAKLLGYTTLPCVRLDHLTSQEQRVYVIAHNALCLETGFDDAALFTELEQLQGYDFTDFILDTEKYITTLDRLQRKELAPIQKAHYLISVDARPE